MMYLSKSWILAIKRQLDPLCPHFCPNMLWEFWNWSGVNSPGFRALGLLLPNCVILTWVLGFLICKQDINIGLAWW